MSEPKCLKLNLLQMKFLCSALQNQASDASKADVNIPKIHWPLDAASASMTVPGSTPPRWCRCPSGRTV